MLGERHPDDTSHAQQRMALVMSRFGMGDLLTRQYLPPDWRISGD